MHVGDVDFEVEDAENIADASWEEVCRTCCCHSPQEWGMIFFGVCLVVFFLYFFLFGLEILGTGAQVMGGCTGMFCFDFCRGFVVPGDLNISRIISPSVQQLVPFSVMRQTP
jgi:hypothetical protein